MWGGGAGHNNMKKMNRQVTLFRNRYGVEGLPSTPKPQHLLLQDVLENVRDGTWACQIQKLRATLQYNGKREYDILKNQLPVVMFGGLFRGQGISDLQQPSNLVILDFDHFQDLASVNQARMSIASDPYTMVEFLSPSGFGLKVLVNVEADTDNTTHHEYFNALRNHFSQNHPELMSFWDDTSKNINRLCFVSHDPELFCNPNSRIWVKREPNTKSKVIIGDTMNVKTNEGMNVNDAEVEKIIHFLEGGWATSAPMTDGHRHDSTYRRARELCEYGVPQDIAIEYFKQFLSEASDPKDIEKQISNAYKKSKFKIRNI